MPKRKERSLDDLIRDSEKLREEFGRLSKEAKNLREQIRAKRDEPIASLLKKTKI